MQKQIRRPIAVFVASALLVALAAGAALAANINGTPGDDLIGAGPYKSVFGKAEG